SFTPRGQGPEVTEEREPEAEPIRPQARQVELATALGARLVEMNDLDRIVDATVEELHGAFGFFACSVIHRRDEENLEMLASRGNAQHTALVDRALRERRTDAADGEVAMPIWIGPELWGA